jgi:putative endonuclease
MVKDGLLAFVEVRTRRGRRLGTPEASITARKQARLAALAMAYLASHPWNGPWRIDVVAIEVGGDGDRVRYAHYPNAVGR